MTSFQALKYRALFRALDAKKDGVLDKSDFEEIGHRAQKECGLSVEIAGNFTRTLGSGVWRKVLNVQGEHACFTEDQFVRFAFERNEEVMRQGESSADYAEGFDLFFQAFDINRNGQITPDDMAMAFRILGLPIWQAPIAFVAVEEKGDGFLRSQDFQLAGREFMSYQRPHASQFLFGIIESNHQEWKDNPLQLISELWVTRMRKLFRILDSNDDRKLETGDFNRLKSRIMSGGQSKRRAELHQLAEKALPRTWTSVLGAQHGNVVYTEMEFVTSVLRQIAVAPAEEFFGAVDSFFLLLFKAADRQDQERLSAGDLAYYYSLLRINQDPVKAISMLDATDRRSKYVHLHDFRGMARDLFRTTKENRADWLLGSPALKPTYKNQKSGNDCSVM